MAGIAPGAVARMSERIIDCPTRVIDRVLSCAKACVPVTHHATTPKIAAVRISFSPNLSYQSATNLSRRAPRALSAGQVQILLPRGVGGTQAEPFSPLSLPKTLFAN